MTMYREPLNYSVWRGFYNDSNEFIRQGLVAYFTDKADAEAYIDNMGYSLAMFDVDRDVLIYPNS